jgi:hypothetical protein
MKRGLSVNFRVVTRYVSYQLFGCFLGHRNALVTLVMVEELRGFVNHMVRLCFEQSARSLNKTTSCQMYPVHNVW